MAGEEPFLMERNDSYYTEFRLRLLVKPVSERKEKKKLR